MGLWQIFDAKGVAQAEQFDDGLAFMPGEDGYSTDLVAEEARKLGSGSTFSLIGVPNWHARVEAEAQAVQAARDAAELDAQRAAAEAERNRARELAEDELNALLNPNVLVRAQINAKFDALLAAAPNRAKDIKKLRTAALEELEA